MKFVKNMVLASLLASVLAVSAFAGEQATPGFVPPPPPQAITICNYETVVCNTDPENTETSDYLFFEALAALLSMY